MAYPYSCAGALNLITNYTANYAIWKFFADGFTLNANTYWLANEDHTAIGQIINALDSINNCTYFNSYSEAPFNTYNALYYYMVNCTGADEFDMDSLLSAMVTASPDQLQYFIGLVDAYRQSLWNKPFNKEYFAALARGFETWE